MRWALALAVPYAPPVLRVREHRAARDGAGGGSLDGALPDPLQLHARDLDPPGGEPRGPARGGSGTYIESVGGKLHGFWYAFGEYDGYTLWEAPDAVSMAAVAIAISGGGALSKHEIPLIRPRGADARRPPPGALGRIPAAGRLAG